MRHDFSWITEADRQSHSHGVEEIESGDMHLEVSGAVVERADEMADRPTTTILERCLPRSLTNNGVNRSAASGLHKVLRVFVYGRIMAGINSVVIREAMRV